MEAVVTNRAIGNLGELKVSAENYNKMKQNVIPEWHQGSLPTSNWAPAPDTTSLITAFQNRITACLKLFNHFHNTVCTVCIFIVKDSLSLPNLPLIYYLTRESFLIYLSNTLTVAWHTILFLLLVVQFRPYISIYLEQQSATWLRSCYRKDLTA